MTVEIASTINDLDERFPLSGDLLSEGDDHLRLIKDVLKRTFPNLTGPVTATEAELNGSAFPPGTRLLFAQAAAPLGWTRVPLATDQTHIITVAPFSDPGGVESGDDDPSVMGKVPTHTHSVRGSTIAAGDTTGTSGSHNHVAQMPPSGAHTHLVQTYPEIPPAPALGTNVVFGGPTDLRLPTSVLAALNTDTAHTHPVTVLASGAHTHTVPQLGIDLVSEENPSADTWRPRSFSTILCEKD